MSKKIGKLKMTRGLFIETMNQLQKQYDHDDQCADAARIIFPDSNVTWYDNHRITNQLVKILERAMNDDDGWIEYFMYEQDFGRDHKLGDVSIDGEDIPLHNADDLYNMLIS